MRYLVFCGADYYPLEGALDFLNAYESMNEATNVARSIIGKTKVVYNEDQDDGEAKDKVEWSQVFDISERKIIRWYHRTPYRQQKTRNTLTPILRVE